MKTSMTTSTPKNVSNVAFASVSRAVSMCVSGFRVRSLTHIPQANGNGPPARPTLAPSKPGPRPSPSPPRCPPRFSDLPSTSLCLRPPPPLRLHPSLSPRLPTPPFRLRSFHPSLLLSPPRSPQTPGACRLSPFLSRPVQAWSRVRVCRAPLSLRPNSERAVLLPCLTTRRIRSRHGSLKVVLMWLGWCSLCDRFPYWRLR